LAVDGLIVKRARESRGKKQYHLAEVIGADQTYISKIEKNKLQGGLKGDELLKIAEYLDYDPYVFLGELSFKQGDLKLQTQRADMQKLYDKMAMLERKVRPTKEVDPLAERVISNRTLRELVDRVKFWEERMLQRLIDIAYGLEKGREFNREKEKTPKEEAIEEGMSNLESKVRMLRGQSGLYSSSLTQGGSPDRE